MREAVVGVVERVVVGRGGRTRARRQIPPSALRLLLCRNRRRVLLAIAVLTLIDSVTRMCVRVWRIDERGRRILSGTAILRDRIRRSESL